MPEGGGGGQPGAVHPPDVGARGGPDIWRGMVAGAVSGMAARVFIHPADTVKAQLQLQGGIEGGPRYKGTLQAVRQVRVPSKMPRPARR